MSQALDSPFPMPAHDSSRSFPADYPSIPEARWARRMIAAAAVIYFVMAWLRYAFFRAGVSDLGYFDQAVYLISRGKTPYVPTLGYAMLADHGAYMIYPLALLYVIYPSVLWLFATQAIALAGSGWFIWRLARQAGATPRWSLALCSAWLVYPAIVMPNLHDFHPEVLAVPALLGMVFYARDRRTLPFLLCLIVALGTKEVIALTAGAMGLWMFLGKRERGYGLAAMVLSAVWFFVATHLLIPFIGQGHQLNGYRLLDYMGNTPGEILRTMALHPLIPLRFALSKASALYLFVLIAPVWWALRPGHLAPLIGALPCVAINILSREEILHNPFYHYSLAIAPAVFLAMISAVAARRAWLERPWMVGAWLAMVVIGGIAARAHQAVAQESPDEPSRSQRQALIDMVGESGGVLSTHQLASHLMHREMVYYVFNPNDNEFTMRIPPPESFDWVLLDFHEDSLKQTGEFGRSILQQYQKDPKFIQLVGAKGLYLLHRVVK
jgi:uncharacterized membrane protein